MSFFFKSKAKSPQDLVKQLRESLIKLDHATQSLPKDQYLLSAKHVLLSNVASGRRPSAPDASMHGLSPSAQTEGDSVSGLLLGPSRSSTVSFEATGHGQDRPISAPSLASQASFLSTASSSTGAAVPSVSVDKPGSPVVPPGSGSGTVQSPLPSLSSFSIAAMLSPDDRKMFEKANEDIAKTLSSMKLLLCGDSENEPVPELVAQFAQEAYAFEILAYLSERLLKIDFEARKDVCQIFNSLLRRQIGARYPTVEYLCAREAILYTLIDGYEYQETALVCGMILRECLRHEPLANVLLNVPTCHLGMTPAVTPAAAPLAAIYKLFDYVELPTFDIASDAFATLKDLLTRHKIMVSQFITAEYDTFFERYNLLLHSNNYVTRRQSLKLLGEILLDRVHFATMTRYVAYPDNLKLMMNLLRDRSRNIQYEAFHIFKIFVVNPNKTKPISDILIKNKEKLLVFLAAFQSDRHDDTQFLDHKTFVIREIQQLEPVAPATVPIAIPTAPPAGAAAPSVAPLIISSSLDAADAAPLSEAAPASPAP